MKTKLRLCIVGPMLGRNSGWVTTQGEILSDLFRDFGYHVLETSSVVNRFGRLFDIVLSLFKFRKDYDIAIVNVFSGAAFFIVDISSLIIKKHKKPLIFVLRGGNLPEFSVNRKKWVKRVLSRGNIIVSPSAYLFDYCNSLDLSSTIIPNVIDLDQYPFRLRNIIEPKLLWMRTFHEIYNPEMAVEVVNILRKSIPNIHLTMAGQEKGRLQYVCTLVKERGLAEVVKFEGFLNKETKQKVFNEHDIYLNTNRIDNTPVSVIEAAAFGIPIIATNVGGIPFLLKSEETGILVESENSNDMAQAILRLINDPQLVQKLSINGRRLAESCSWQNVLKMWQKVFSDLNMEK